MKLPELLNPIDLLKSKLKSLDIDHDGHPDIVPALQAVDKAVVGLEAISARLTPAEIDAGLKAFNAATGHKLTDAEIAAASEGIAHTPAALDKLHKIILSSEKGLS